MQSCPFTCGVCSCIRYLNILTVEILMSYMYLLLIWLVRALETSYSYSYIRNMDLQILFFCLLCFILAFKKILSVVIIIFNCSEIEKWDSTDRFLCRMSFWNILDDNILSCKWDFNWCNDLLSYSFHWLKQMACSTQQKWELVN